mmetsp:Transcript_6254/g.17495  ORF Transcript_6254/g.17495 Transcript_6254/m.17495 type:complete len:275 (+) Transcript_6254:422-1246(+)
MRKGLRISPACPQELDEGSASRLVGVSGTQLSSTRIPSSCSSRAWLREGPRPAALPAREADELPLAPPLGARWCRRVTDRARRMLLDAGLASRSAPPEGSSIPVEPVSCDLARESTSHRYTSETWWTCSISCDRRIPSCWMSSRLTQTPSITASGFWETALCTPLWGRRKRTRPGRHCAMAPSKPAGSFLCSTDCRWAHSRAASSGMASTVACMVASGFFMSITWWSQNTLHLLTLQSARDLRICALRRVISDTPSRGTTSFPATTEVHQPSIF